MARAREFDEQALLDGAQELFWSYGLDATSIERVSAATGVGNGSIYAAYGTKLGLFLAVFERYCRQRADFVAEVMASSPGRTLDAVRAFLDAIIADCGAQPGRRGCLMINSLAQLGDRVPEIAPIAAESTRRMESSLAERLTALDDSPAHWSAADVASVSASAVLMSQGLIQMSRLGTTTEQLHELADVFCMGLLVDA